MVLNDEIEILAESIEGFTKLVSKTGNNILRRVDHVKSWSFTMLQSYRVIQTNFVQRRSLAFCRFMKLLINNTICFE